MVGVISGHLLRFDRRFHYLYILIGMLPPHPNPKAKYGPNRIKIRCLFKRLIPLTWLSYSPKSFIRLSHRLHIGLTYSFSSFKTSRCVILCPQAWQAKSEDTIEVSSWTTFPRHFLSESGSHIWSSGFDPTTLDWQTRVELWLPFSVGSEHLGQEHVKYHLSRSLIRRRSLPWRRETIGFKYHYFSLTLSRR